MAKKCIFICYSHEDQDWLKKVEPFLKVLESYADMEWWADTRIEPGENWEKEIKQTLNHAAAALLLVSTPFLNSTFIKEKEIPILLQRFEKQGVILIPILVSECNWELVPWLKPIQFFNHTDSPLEDMKKGKRSKYFKKLNQKILDLLQGKPIEKTPGDKKNQGDGAKTTLLTKCPPAHIDLIGRETELRDLEMLLNKNKAVVLVNGMGGIGKTEVCRTFFHKYHGGFAYAGWVDYHSSLKESFFSAIYEDILGENRGENMEERFNKIIHFLQSQPGQVFLVVDNIDNERDPDLVELTSLRSPVLLNSRQRLEGFQPYSLDVLDMKGCKELFYRYYEIERNEEMVEGLIGRCGNHTLTVELLARVGQQAGIKLEELLGHLSQEGLSLGEVGEESVRTFWHSESGEKKLLEHLRVVFDLSKIGEEEKWILLNLSILPAIYIDQENIKKWLGLKSGGVIERLVKGGWLRRRGGEIFMHQVVQEVVRSKQKPTVAKCGNLVKALGDLLDVEPGENPLSKKVWLVYGEVVLGHLVEEEESLATLANNLSEVYYYLGDLARARSFQEQAHGICEKTLEKDHPALATSYNNLSMIYKDLGNLARALSVQEQAVAISEKILGKDHPDLANSYNNLSLIYHDLGDLDRALSFQKKALAIREKILGKDHPDLATSYNNISLIYKDLGDMVRALAFQEQANEIFEKTLGKDHPSLASSYHNLSSIYQFLGDLDRALAFQEQALAIIEKTLGKDHPSLATSYSNLSMIYQDMGELSRALSFQEQALAIREKTLGKDHPVLATSYHNLSGIYQDMGELSRALSVQEQAVAIFEKTLGKDHPSLATSYHNLSTIYRDLKNYHQALFFSRKAVNIVQNLFPNGHPNLDIMIRNLEKIEKKAAAAGEIAG